MRRNVSESKLRKTVVCNAAFVFHNDLKKSSSSYRKGYMAVEKFARFRSAMLLSNTAVVSRGCTVNESLQPGPLTSVAGEALFSMGVRSLLEARNSEHGDLCWRFR
ncbi:hypothetical protein RRG08_036332 [Elysia crispata]|uniref:Uncharacterized protein n=1 Tax=Elysia crispata TaxID=231223 RepID=A0AAE0ZP91_9GAST|nr:hypothetical protein RRG08_036332 [Elysia crispata]